VASANAIAQRMDAAPVRNGFENMLQAYSLVYLDLAGQA
jgi:hypothetical protein